jgi:hypothetical protein
MRVIGPELKIGMQGMFQANELHLLSVYRTHNCVFHWGVRVRLSFQYVPT